MAKKPHRGGVAELDVWWKAREMVVEVYRLAATLPDIERFALASQLRRAAVSVTLNLAEGQARWYLGDYQRSISNACASCAEVEAILTIGIDLGYFDEKQLQEPLASVQRVGRMLNGLYYAIRRREQQVRMECRRRGARPGSPGNDRSAPAAGGEAAGVRVERA